MDNESNRTLNQSYPIHIQWGTNKPGVTIFMGLKIASEAANGHPQHPEGKILDSGSEAGMTTLLYAHTLRLPRNDEVRNDG